VTAGTTRVATRGADRAWPAKPPRARLTCACGGGCPRCTSNHHHGSAPLLQAIDAREREAERWAERALELERRPNSAPGPRAARHPGDVDTSTLATRSGSIAAGLRSPWRQLDDTVRETAQSAFGRTLGEVRVHDNAQAAASAQALDANAYTAGADIVFGRGQHAPGSRTGRRLLFHELAHVAQQRSSASAELARDRPPASGSVSGVTIDCASSRITFNTHQGVFSYVMTHCNVTPGEYDATVSVRPGEVHFDLGATVSASINFEFGYDIAPGQPNPSTFFGRQRSVHISAPDSLALPASGLELPVTFAAVPLDDASLLGFAGPVGSIGLATNPASSGLRPDTRAGASSGWSGYPFTVGAMGSHVLASGDFSWLSRADAASRVLSREYWSPLVPGRGYVTLDRLTNTLPRNLAPRIASELASGGPFSWVVERGFTEAELRSIPELVERLNTRGIGSLNPAELEMLRRAAALHIGGATPGAPFASYSVAGRTAPFLSGEAASRYRVRVEIPRTGALDVSTPNAFNLGEEALTNLDEAEFLVVADQRGRIVSVQRVASSGVEPGFLMRNASAIRWGGRLLFVAGIGLSAHRIATATPAERPIVAAEEAGGHAGGAGGAALAVAGCTFFGVASGGIGLLLCGLGGGILGGAVGSGVAGSLARTARDGTGSGTVCPSCHSMQREWERERAWGGAATGLGSFSLGESRLPSDATPVSARPGVPGATPLDAESLAALRRWLAEADAAAP
jgi:hypothetical protein